MPSHPVILLKAIWLIADKRKREMAQHNENRPIDGAVELLQNNGFDALAEAVTVLLMAALWDIPWVHGLALDQSNCCRPADSGH